MRHEDYSWIPLLEQLRHDQSQFYERPCLRLPIPTQMPLPDEEFPLQEEKDTPRGVIIIDMLGSEE